ncbi:YqiA/YcfP family alpha/beta fold hydrolase [Sulfurimonas sp.]
MITIYIHGFGGSGNGVKATLFREYYNKIQEQFLAPSLSYVPDLAINTLEEFIERYNGRVNLIGSSLGGYYALYLANKYNLKAALINPSIYPYETLTKVLGYAPNFYDESKFQWNTKHILMLKKFEVSQPKEKNFFLLLQKGDEILDYKEALNKLPQAQLFIQERGNHSFENIQEHFKSIQEFFNSNS